VKQNEEIVCNNLLGNAEMLIDVKKLFPLGGCGVAFAYRWVFTIRYRNVHIKKMKKESNLAKIRKQKLEQEKKHKKHKKSNLSFRVLIATAPTRIYRIQIRE